MDAPAWARVMDRDPTPTGLSAVSKAWTRLVKLGLVERSRQGRKAKLILLCEDGSGEPYTRPRTPGDGQYLKLPHAYWLQDWYTNLDLAAKATLLIALSLADGFYLPFDRVEDWYGISRNTAQRGMATLVDKGLLERDERWEPEPLSAIGYRPVIHYTLRPPFGPRNTVLTLVGKPGHTKATGRRLRPAGGDATAADVGT